MQKKLIALAVAGLMSAPAFAQSNVTVYGLVDFGYVHTGDSAVDGRKSRNAIDAGNSAGNRLGFKGTEDLGNGLKASFVYETGVQGDYSTGTGLWGGSGNRQAYVALSSSFGTVALGRQYAPQYTLASAVDAFSRGTVATIANVYMHESRLDNLAAYVSPNWSGFSFVTAYTNSVSGDEGIHNDFGNQAASSDARAWAISPSYKNGPVYVALNVHQIRRNDGSSTTKVWDLGGTYDLGVVKLGAIYGMRDIKDSVKHSQWGLTAAVPVGAAGKIQASYIHRKSDWDAAVRDAKVSQWGIGYLHELSKRTAIYTAFSDINNKGSAKDGGPGAAFVGTAQGSISGSYQRGFTVGLRHTF